MGRHRTPAAAAHVPLARALAAGPAAAGPRSRRQCGQRGQDVRRVSAFGQRGHARPRAQGERDGGARRRRRRGWTCPTSSDGGPTLEARVHPDGEPTLQLLAEDMRRIARVLESSEKSPGAKDEGRVDALTALRASLSIVGRAFGVDASEGSGAGAGADSSGADGGEQLADAAAAQIATLRKALTAAEALRRSAEKRLITEQRAAAKARRGAGDETAAAGGQAAAKSLQAAAKPKVAASPAAAKARQAAAKPEVTEIMGPVSQRAVKAARRRAAAKARQDAARSAANPTTSSQGGSGAMPRGAPLKRPRRFPRRVGRQRRRSS